MNEQLKPFLAGFDLAGRRLPNGKLQSYGLKEGLMDDWPEEVELFGITYVLENVIKGEEGYESGVYV
jgi:hypothetical protein